MGTKHVYWAIIVVWLTLFEGNTMLVKGDFNYKEALTKSLIFLEAQRSGKLPSNNRVPWRGDSALDDGKLVNVDLAGGYYDAGDNVKYGLPMAFTVTTLAWGAIFYKPEFEAANELGNVHDAIRWGTDYFLKASSRHKRLYVEVGDPEDDHHCWAPPENMKTKRSVKMITSDIPGTEIAAETAAAMAASSIVFRPKDRKYARRLLNRAKLLFQMANSNKGTYDGECPFYCSYSGYNDEMMWAATWLYMATRKSVYMKYITEECMSASVAEFSWDLKYAGAQILLSQLHFEGQKNLETFKSHAESFICSVLPDSPYHQIKLSPGGFIHLRDGANTQYATGTSFLFTVYSDLLAKHNQKVTCGDKQFSSSHLLAFAKKQVSTYIMDYILGNNPEGRSYMVGFGKNPPTQAHHRGASVSILKKGEEVVCALSFTQWFQKDEPNPNELTGAILGGPDINDKFNDKRWDSPKTEPCTYINSLAAGALAKLASLG
ncbi:endoglucanase 16-like [Glycine soja]|uniref:endoglucanase 16-like n=1 Tax=Glycine soja TaxID=3848 RepID=UPI0003DE7B7D|nr:endoglucanase 16-like [Glycine soja]XP_040872214.1 endoglucanase 16 [Glycine max]